MRRHGLLERLLIAAAFAALPGFCLAGEEQSLLTPDGTLHVVRSGRAVDLGVQDASASPEDNLIEWTSLKQDGSVATALIPGTDSAGNKRNLQLAFDDQTQTLLLLWSEDMFPFSQVRIGVLRDGSWRNFGLLPNQGLSGAYNPRMAITHQAVTYRDEHDALVSKTSSILSIIWWEEALVGQARLANLFLDEENFDPAGLTIQDLPALAGGGGKVSYEGIPSGAYMYPSLQADGLSGAVLVSFADLHDQTHKVVRIQFPSDQGKPAEPGNLTWQRRHTPIVSISTSGPVPRMTPILATGTTRDAGVGTSIGAGYRPTLYWRDGGALKYTRLEGADWTSVRSIPIDEAMTYERALALVSGMGQRN
jgi:hypothetical protein